MKPQLLNDWGLFQIQDVPIPVYLNNQQTRQNVKNMWFWQMSWTKDIFNICVQIYTE